MIASARKQLARVKVLKSVYRGAREVAFGALYSISPLAMAKVRYREAWGRWPDLEHPRLFDEKLLWLKLNDRDPLRTRCADKYTMRGYVAEAGMEDLLPKLIGVYDRVEDVDFGVFPDRFVIKCTHGCRCNVFCRNKGELDEARARADLQRWMGMDFSRLSGEVHYAAMTPRIICEEFLEQPGSDLPNDYKVYCFHGHARCTMTCTERTRNGKPMLDFYDRAWAKSLPFSMAYTRPAQPIPRPPGYERMLEAAEKLSRPFPFVRMDFYSIGDRVLLGEMTFTPGGCVSADYLTQEAQKCLGEWMEIETDRRR